MNIFKMCGLAHSFGFVMQMAASTDGNRERIYFHAALSVGRIVWKIVISIIRYLKLITANPQLQFRGSHYDELL
jgi:hypothetical protein